MPAPKNRSKNLATTRHNWAARQVWTTGDEIAYLAGLGMHTWCERSQDTREALLRRYLKTMATRTHWGDIDEMLVRSACQRMLAACF